MLTILTALVFTMPAPRIAAGDAPALARARAELNAAVAALTAGPTLAGERRVRVAMGRVDRLVDASFHAPNLRQPDARAPALALRHEVQLSLAGPHAVLAIRDDVLHFRPAVHRALADAARVRGAHARVVEHLRAALALGAHDLDHLAALKEAYLALGQVGRAEQVAARIEILSVPRP